MRQSSLFLVIRDEIMEQAASFVSASVTINGTKDGTKENNIEYVNS